MGFSLGMSITVILKHMLKKNWRKKDTTIKKKEKGNEMTMSWKKRNKKEGERKRHRECKPKQPRATKR